MMTTLILSLFGFGVPKELKVEANDTKIYQV